MLPAPGNADNGDSKQQTENQVRERYPYTADKDPDNVEDRGQATRLPRHVSHLPAKWKQSKETNLKTLQSKRNTDNRQAKEKTADHILYKCKKAPEDEPDDVTN